MHTPMSWTRRCCAPWWGPMMLGLAPAVAVVVSTLPTRQANTQVTAPMAMPSVGLHVHVRGGSELRATATVEGGEGSRFGGSWSTTWGRRWARLRCRSRRLLRTHRLRPMLAPAARLAGFTTCDSSANGGSTVVATPEDAVVETDERGGFLRRCPGAANPLCAPPTVSWFEGV